MTAAERLIPPYNEDAEAHVVGACLISESAFETVAELMDPKGLFIDRHRYVFDACVALANSGKPIEPTLVREHLLADGKAEAAKSVAALVALVPSTSNIAHYVDILHEYLTRRRLIIVGQDIANSGWDPEAPGPVLIDRAEASVYALSGEQQRGELAHVSESLEHTMANLSKPGGEITGTPSGLRDLDIITSGYQPGQLVVVAARPGMGKSALVINQAVHVSVQKLKTVALFTLEMSEEEINQRALAQISGVNLHTIRTRIGLTTRDRERLDNAKTLLDHSGLHVDDTASLRLTDIRARARRLKARKPDLALIVVDYLQLMLSEEKTQNRNLEISGITRGLKVIARELEVPVVALSQLSRGPETRFDKRPMLSDLRDSGAIEQDADVVVFIYRDGYYTKEDDTVAELHVAKHRNGPVGTPTVAWHKDTAEFRNIARTP